MWNLFSNIDPKNVKPKKNLKEILLVKEVTKLWKISYKAK